MPSHVPLNLRKPIQPRDPNTNTDETCGTCALCCKLLQIEPEPEKDFEGKGWNKWCQHCKPGNLPGGCQRYDTRPSACSGFECLWLVSQHDSRYRTLPAKMKPYRSHVILMQSPDDFNVMHVHVDPAYPRAWRQEPMRSHLIQVANAGATVVVVLGWRRFIMTRGRPTFEITEGQLQQLAEDRYITMKNGDVHLGVRYDK